MDKNKIRVGILFGGKSAEHEVSLQSAKNVIAALDQQKYQPVLIGIDKSGRWLLNERSTFLLNSHDPKLIALNQGGDRVALIPQNEGKLANLTRADFSERVDVVFPILHGPLGEDGTVQGLLKLADIPFVGAGVLGSAIGMDKDVMKRLLRDAGIAIADFVTLRSEKEAPPFDVIAESLGIPVFVKPANMGSSVGVSRVVDRPAYEKALAEAFAYDRKVLIEQYIEGRELECSVLGNDDPIASVAGEVIAAHDFYSYEAKYIDENGAILEIPAKLGPEIQTRFQQIAIETFRVTECEGFARVDGFLTPDDRIIVNEINTIPGFTAISMYPKLWEASGISYTELIDRLIQLALDRFEKEKRLKTNYGL